MNDNLHKKLYIFLKDNNFKDIKQFYINNPSYISKINFEDAIDFLSYSKNMNYKIISFFINYNIVSFNDLLYKKIGQKTTMYNYFFTLLMVENKYNVVEQIFKMYKYNLTTYLNSNVINCVINTNISDMLSYELKENIYIKEVKFLVKHKFKVNFININVLLYQLIKFNLSKTFKFLIDYDLVSKDIIKKFLMTKDINTDISKVFYKDHYKEVKVSKNFSEFILDSQKLYLPDVIKFLIKYIIKTNLNQEFIYFTKNVLKNHDIITLILSFLKKM